MILPPFDHSRTTSKLCYLRAVFQLPTSMVAITDSASRTILQVYFGTHDQLVAERMMHVLKSADSSPTKFISPYDSDFSDLCSLLLNLRLPLVSRKNNPIYYAQGYLVDPAEFYQVVKAARDNKYLHASKYASEKSFSIEGTLKCYDNIDISLLKCNSDQS